MFSDKSESAHKVVQNSACGQHKASVVDFITPEHVVVNTEFDTNRVKDSTVSKHKMFQSQVGWISSHNAGFPGRGKSNLDLVHKYEDASSVQVGKCYSIPLRNRYQLLETEQEDQVRTPNKTVTKIVLCRTGVGKP